MHHLKTDFGVTAWIATLVIIGAFVLLFKGVDQSLETALVTLIGAIVSGFAVIKSAKQAGGK
jgi:hypothetical protein